MSTTAKVLIGVGVGVLVLVLIGIFAVSRLLDQVDELVDSGAIDDFVAAEETDLQVGDCFLADSPSIAVPCGDAHSHEVFAVDRWTESDERPSVFDAFLFDCDASFESYVGIDYYQSDFFYDVLPPTQAAWDAGDRNVRCALYEPGETLIGSARGLAR